MSLPLLFVGLLTQAWAGTVRVDVLDVGQGDSILIRTPANKAILIDASDNQAKVPALLTALGVTALDLVIATHPHADHIGGMDEVLDAFPVKNYIDSGLPHTTATYAAVMSRVEAKKIPYRTGLTGMSFNLDDGAVLEILFPTGTPLKDTRSDLNSNSVVARLTHGDDCFLFPGDAEEPTERALVAAGLAQSDVLKVPHHGSNHSSTPAFLAAVKPSIAVISVGTGNRYGHPGEETLGRLAGTGAAIYRTDLMGTVTLLSDGKKIKVETQHPSTAVADAAPPTEPRATTQAASVHAVEKLTPAAAEAVPPNACPYPASASSEVFHEEGCGNAEKISAANLVCYATREQAVKAGRRPAGCCKP